MFAAGSNAGRSGIGVGDAPNRCMPYLSQNSPSHEGGLGKATQASRPCAAASMTPVEKTLTTGPAKRASGVDPSTVIAFRRKPSWVSRESRSHSEGCGR